MCTLAFIICSLIRKLGSVGYMRLLIFVSTICKLHLSHRLLQYNMYPCADLDRWGWMGCLTLDTLRKLKFSNFSAYNYWKYGLDPPLKNMARTPNTHPQPGKQTSIPLQKRVLYLRMCTVLCSWYQSMFSDMVLVRAMWIDLL